MTYLQSMNDRAYEIHEWAKSQGWFDHIKCDACEGQGTFMREGQTASSCLSCNGSGWDMTKDPSFVPHRLMLIVTEVAEAQEGWRNEDPDNVAEELADVIIRTLDVAQFLGINIEQEIINKHQKNLKRPRLNGRKR